MAVAKAKRTNMNLDSSPAAVPCGVTSTRAKFFTELFFPLVPHSYSRTLKTKTHRRSPLQAAHSFASKSTSPLSLPLAPLFPPLTLFTGISTARIQRPRQAPS